MVSVIIPTYKRPGQLLKAVSSVMQQTYADFELLVVNDDESDTDGIEVRLTALNDSRIRYLKNKRKKGGNGARNTGILHSNGQYIAFLDDDDTWLPNKLARQVTKMDGFDDTWGACYCGWQIEGKVRTAGFEGDLLSYFLTKRAPIGASSTLMIRAVIINETGLWDEELKRFQDYDFFAKIVANYKVGFVDKPLVNIDGHHPPRYETLKGYNDLYLNSIFAVKKIVDHPQYPFFLARQYRDMALYAALEGYTGDVVLFLKKSLKHKALPLKNYLSVLVYFINYFTFKFEFGLFKRQSQ